MKTVYAADPMELNKYELKISSGRNEIEQTNKFPAIGMLKESNGLDQMVEAVPSKDQEFIDHTLLAPEYIRDSNNFIMDLIDQQNVFQKATVNTSAFTEKEQSLESELHLQNEIFHFVNKHDQIQCSTGGVSIIESSVTDSSITFGNKDPPNFITLNANFLGGSTDCSTNNLNVHHQYSSLANTTLASICDITQANKPNVSPLSILGDVEINTSNFISEPDLNCSRSNSKKVLPHKKRISKKLRGTQCNGSSLNTVVVERKEMENPLHEHNVIQFSCEICAHTTSSQLDFFAHLKQHYEPSTPDALLDTMKNPLNEIHHENNPSENKCISGKRDEHINVGQVFTEVHNINFEDFPQVDAPIVQALNQSNQNDDMKILNSNSIDKCIQFVSHREIEPPKNQSSDEIEFSDTEDMLEGIRNVVDKVSIEDTCDAMDMVTSNNIRTPWFANSNFPCISFKSKILDNSDISNSISNDPSLLKSNIQKDETLNASKSENHINLSEDEMKSACIDNSSDCDELNSENLHNSTVSTNNDCDKWNETSPKKLLEEHDDQDISVGEEKKRQFCCTKCNRKFNSNNALKYHNRTHTGVRPHQCDVCGRSFFAQGALKSHMRTHTGDKPFECEQCHRKFRQLGDLKYHTTSIHNGEKCHQCEFCGKAFSRKYSLVLHRRIHTSERNYKCEFCPKSFRASIYLQNHRKIHTGEKPYECDTCSKKFRVSGDLRRHIRTHQRKEIKEESEHDSIR